MFVQVQRVQRKPGSGFCLTTMSGAPQLKPISAVFQLPPEELIFGRSPAMRAVRQKALKIAGTNVPVLILGGAGTGKEILARWIHLQSPWRSGPYVRVNCAAIPGTLLESELFGYEKGAFSGADRLKPGRVEQADQGTLFLDEIAEIDLDLQAKLLEFMQDGRFNRIGGREERRIEARIICATNRKLESEIQTGGFRPDLFYRINVVQLQMPFLSARKEDIPSLVDYFVSVCNARFERQSPGIDEKTKQILQTREWPGNIRELENWVARRVLLGDEDPFAAEMLGHPASESHERNEDGHGISLKRKTKNAILRAERQVILEVLRANQWNRRKAAGILKISYRALIYKIRQAGLSSSRSEETATLPGNS
jgi:two-component system, NtrC family, response regulator AtoC